MTPDLSLTARIPVVSRRFEEKIAGVRRRRSSGVEDANSSGGMLWLGPSFLLSDRNLMLKGGVRFPITQNLNGIQLASDYEGVIAAEIDD